MNANEILAASRNRYATINSYCDEGFVLSKWEDQIEPDRIEFKTWFVRPDRFRFEWTSVDMSRVVWSNGKGAFSYDKESQVITKRKSLPSAIAGATGVSLGAAHTVSALLMDKTGGRIILDLERPTADEELFDGIRCYRVHGYHPGSICEVLIDSQDFFIRRSNDDPYNTEVRKNIRIDEEIAPEIFEFSPPHH